MMHLEQSTVGVQNFKVDVAYILNGLSSLPSIFGTIYMLKKVTNTK